LNTLFQLFGTPAVDTRWYTFCSLVWCSEYQDVFSDWIVGTWIPALPWTRMDLRQHRGANRHLRRGASDIFPCFHRLLQYVSLLSVCTHSCAFAWGSVKHERIWSGRFSGMRRVNRLYARHHREVQVSA
jgi:hypothetical protein